jgi:hypothetical protein
MRAASGASEPADGTDRMKRLGIAALVAISLMAAEGLGQVALTQDGRALDANYLIGSGGINSVRRADRYLDGNLLITGQVTGGFEFRGRVPYAGADQLRLELPSAGLDNFIRGSAGLDQVQSGGLYGPSPYLSPQRTVLGPSGIASGLTRPGTSVPQSAYVSAEQARQLIDSAVQAYTPLLPELSRQLRVDALVPSAVEVTPGLRPGALPTAERLQAGAIRPTASTLFGILREQDKQRLAEELTEAERIRRERSVGEPLEARVEAPLPSPGPPTGRQPPAETPRPEPGEPAKPQLPQPGQDVFVDMLLALRQIRQAQEAGAQPPEEQPPRRAQKRPGETEEEQAQQEAALEQTRERLILHGLAGGGKDLLNLRLARAQKLLAEGKYYEAAGQYELASVAGSGVSPADPRAWLGAALAFFAADEPLTSGYYLEQAMKRFPPLMEVAVDVKGLLGEKIVSLRIGQLEARIKQAGEKADASLVFLAGFIRSARGEPQAAREHAAALKRMAGADQLFRTYADYLLTGRVPTTGPTTAPAPSAKGS